MKDTESRIGDLPGVSPWAKRDDNAFAKAARHERLRQLTEPMPQVLFNSPTMQRIRLDGEQFSVVPDLSEFETVDYRLERRPGARKHTFSRVYAQVDSGGGQSCRVFALCNRTHLASFLGYGYRLGVSMTKGGFDE